MNDQAEYMIHRLLSVDSNTPNKLDSGLMRDEMEFADEYKLLVIEQEQLVLPMLSRAEMNLEHHQAFHTIELVLATLN
ncbi:hypothetical protein BDB01DRAFT_847452 [Pilobolus umbonatus]|nr:hypothetical protein BDB01DRAFT_847452 [Pilobolus umbonatus]